MRQIKFKGMGIDGNWHFGNLSVINKKFDHIEVGSYISNTVGLPFAYSVRPETVGQYTGLKDKNVKEVYEGDVLSCGHNAVVVFIEGRFEAVYNKGTEEIMEDDLCTILYKNTVIGNIHDRKQPDSVVEQELPI